MIGLVNRDAGSYPAASMNPIYGGDFESPYPTAKDEPYGLPGERTGLTNAAMRRSTGDGFAQGRGVKRFPYRSHKPVTAGSTPAPAFVAVAHLVERQAVVLKVAGSSPASHRPDYPLLCGGGSNPAFNWEGGSSGSFFLSRKWRIP